MIRKRPRQLLRPITGTKPEPTLPDPKEKPTKRGKRKASKKADGND